MRSALPLLLILVGLAAVGASLLALKSGNQPGQATATGTCNWTLADRWAARKWIAGYGYDAWMNITVNEEGRIADVTLWYDYEAYRPMAGPDAGIRVVVTIDGSTVYDGHPQGGRVVLDIPARYEDNSYHDIRVYTYTRWCMAP